MITFSLTATETDSLYPVSSGTYNGKHALGQIITARYEIQTDKAYGAGANSLDNLLGDFRIMEGAFLPNGYTLEPTTTPLSPFWYLKLTSSILPATYYSMSWSGSSPYTANNKNGKLEIKFEDSGGFIKIVLLKTFIITADLEKYPDGTSLEAKFRFYKNSYNNINVNNNSTPCVFSELRTLRMCIYYTEASTATQTIFKADIEYAARFFNKKELNATNDILTDFNYSLERCGGSVNNLSTSDKTKVTAFVTIDTGVVFTPMVLTVYLLRVDTSNNSVSFLDSHEWSLAEITTSGSPGTLTYPVADFNGGAALESPSQAPTITTGSTYEAFFNINNASLLDGATYRLLFVYSYNDASSDIQSMSFISEDIKCDGLPCPCPLKITGSITDYLNTYLNNLEVSPQERLKNSLKIELGDFGTCGGTFSEIYKVELKVYTDSGVIRHILDQRTIVRNLSGVFTDYSDFKLTDTGSSFIIDYDYRVRYEPDIPNITSISYVNPLLPTILPTPTGSQDWVNKDIYFEFRIYAKKTAPVNHDQIFVFSQVIHVLPFDETIIDIAFEDTLTGDDITQLCEDTEEINVNISKIDTGDDYVLCGIDKKPYSINKFEEEEIFLGELPKLSSPKIQVLSTNFISNLAAAKVFPQQLDTGNLYRFTVIKKKNKLPLCANFCGLNFAGGSEYLEFPASIDYAFADNDFTYSFWIKGNSTTLKIGVNVAGNWIWVTAGHGAIPLLQLLGTGNLETASRAGSSGITETCAHYAFVKETNNADNWKIYVNGVRVDDTTGTNNNPIGYGTYPFRIEPISGTDATIRDLIVYPQALTEDQILQLYNGGFGVELTSYFGLILMCKFTDVDNGITANDLALGNNGTLYNFGSRTDLGGGAWTCQL